MAAAPSASPPPSPVAVGEDAWLESIDAERRKAESSTLEGQVGLIEHYQRAVSAEPDSIKLWVAYCDFFWSLYTAAHRADSAWSIDEQQIARETFTIDAALNLWQEGYEATKYRLADSSDLWDRWISLELELLSRTRTEQGVRRITHLFKDRLTVPHTRWADTSSLFSGFLSEYHRDAYEQEMQDVTKNAKDAHRLCDIRDKEEVKLSQAAKSGDQDQYRAALREYIDFEIFQTRNSKTKDKDRAVTFRICLGLFSRALTGALAFDEDAWVNYVVFLSAAHTDTKSGKLKPQDDISRVLPNILDTLQRAVQHCPGSGTLWARYILAAEVAGLSFTDIEKIKHAATNSSQLDKPGMTGVLEMYSAWCGYLKRTAMNPHATEEMADLAEMGLSDAISAAQHWGKRRFGDEYQGDHQYRLERIYIQYLTEKKDATEEARKIWKALSEIPVHANSYDFWLNFYLWEMLVFQAAKTKGTRSPTPSTVANGLRVPTLATDVFTQALARKSLDWPERIMEVFIQHCNDYALPETLRNALDTVHKTRKAVARRREREAAEAQVKYAEQTKEYYSANPQATAEEPTTAAAGAQTSPSTGKRKRDEEVSAEADGANKKARSTEANGTGLHASAEDESQKLKRDREHTTVLATNFPADITQTKIRQFFREYGHVVNITSKKEDDGNSVAALVEFKTSEEASSALLRHGKYSGPNEVSVQLAKNQTLYVTNYPPEADENYIRNVFKSCGEVFSIRFPSLNFNTRRRFCYVSFRDSESAAKATKLDGKLLRGSSGAEFRLLAKYSDPTNRQARSGALEEGREVKVSNLGSKATEDDVRELFAKHGSVERVNLLRKMNGQSRGTAFVSFGTKEQAQDAVSQLDKTNFHNQILDVQLAEKQSKTTATTHAAGASASPSPAPSGQHDEEGDSTMPDAQENGEKTASQPKPSDIAARTIAVLNIPDTVNDARVRAVLEPLGTVTRLILHPSHGGAIVEFGDEATAGKAGLAVEGIELDGKKLRVGTVPELFRSKGEVRVDRVDIPASSAAKKDKPKEGRNEDKKVRDAALMPPPTTVRRPQALGSRPGGGPKRGLGFAGAVSVGAKKSGPAVANGTTALNGGKEINGTANGEAHVNGNGAVESGAAPVPKKSNADFKAMFLNSGKAAE